MPTPFLKPTILVGQHVRLEPLSRKHRNGLIAATKDGELWRLWYTSAPSADGMEAEIRRRLDLLKAGSMLPFTVVDTASGQIVGMTTYMNVDSINRRVEIGSTWYAQSVQRTALNTEAKLLLLRHAFEQLGCIAVEFRTHFMNQQSRRAIERLGAKLDGVLRSHSLASDGTLRDTCVYSITAAEWPAVQSHLRWQLQRPRS
jgi:RimJ/RimL family protein N-acetyltransferase